MKSILNSLLGGQRRRPRPPRPQTIISRQIGKAIAGLIIAGGAALFGLNINNKGTAKSVVASQNQAVQISESDPNSALLNALNTKKELFFVEIKSAEVIKLLRNDNRGARHQRWIIQLPNSEPILAVYNIDLSEKIPLSPGDIIDLAGELKYDDKKKTPLIHWLHDDPQKKRKNGYVIHNDKKYGTVIQ